LSRFITNSTCLPAGRDIYDIFLPACRQAGEYKYWDVFLERDPIFIQENEEIS